MQIDRIALRLRPRSGVEAADLGVRLCQVNAAAVYTAYAAVAIPTLTLALATREFAGWLPIVLIWWSKPWLDRSILFVLSRAAFGQPARAADLWRAQRQFWWRHFFFTWTVRRLSIWRSLTDPIYGLEGLGLRESGRRARQLRRRQIGGGLMLTHTFAAIEFSMLFAIVSLAFWLAPGETAPDLTTLFFGPSDGMLLFVSAAYAATVFVVEPFYVAAGFAMYLNRRSDLEAWDVEQELRRVFAR